MVAKTRTFMPNADADDIARIAALRGRDANYYARLQRSAAERISDQTVGSIYRMQPDSRADLRAFDQLPEHSRAFVRESVMPLNAISYDSVLESCHGDEDTLMSRLTSMSAAHTRTWVLRHYGSDHPSVRKYG